MPGEEFVQLNSPRGACAKFGDVVFIVGACAVPWQVVLSLFDAKLRAIAIIPVAPIEAVT